MNRLPFVVALLTSITVAWSMPARADLAQTLTRVKPAIVGIGTVIPTRAPARSLNGTGFVVGDGRTVITNMHVLPAATASDKQETLVVIAGTAEQPQVRAARTVALDAEHDIAVLRIDGTPLPVLALGDSDALREGASIAFTGFPMGLLLGLHPATHRGTVSAITPFVIPSISPRQLDAKTIRRMARPFFVFQLDATAYPGNSGSPIYDPETGVVYGVLNSVFVKESKENLLKQPSGIAYAIPANFIRELLETVK
jgi:serine protease Do